MLNLTIYSSLVRGRKNVRDARNIVLGARKGYEGMPPKKFSMIQNDFFDTIYMSTFLFVFNFEKVLFSNLKIELCENAADKHSGKGKNSNTVPMLWNFSVLSKSVYK